MIYTFYTLPAQEWSCPSLFMCVRTDVKYFSTLPWVPFMGCVKMLKRLDFISGHFNGRICNQEPPSRVVASTENRGLILPAFLFLPWLWTQNELHESFKLWRWEELILQFYGHLTQLKKKRQISITVLHFLIKNLKIMLFTSPTRTNKKETQELQKKKVTVSRSVHCQIGSQPLHWKCLFWKYRLSDPLRFLAPVQRKLL